MDGFGEDAEDIDYIFEAAQRLPKLRFRRRAPQEAPVTRIRTHSVRLTLTCQLPKEAPFSSDVSSGDVLRAIQQWSSLQSFLKDTRVTDIVAEVRSKELGEIIEESRGKVQRWEQG